ncbi:MAG: carbon-nitrogen hydrolase family protein [Firmicutes bacterium]|nr:carbon-nitrogen hydrolase family protein [Bacillota bacterium]
MGFRIHTIKIKEELFSKHARENNCYVVYNTLVRNNGRNACISKIIGRDGRFIGEYVKTHKIEGLDIDLALGSDMPVFELDFGKVGLMAGTDIFIPELAEIYSIKGAEILLCSLGVWPLRDDTEQNYLLRGRAIADYFYVAASAYASHTGMYMTNNYELLNRENGYSIEQLEKSFNSNGLGRHTGRAAVYDLRGDVIASTGREKGFIICEIDLSKKRQIEKYIYGYGSIVYHQNQRGIFKDILKSSTYEKKVYSVEKPVIGFVQMSYSDTISSNEKSWYIKQCDYINSIASKCDIVICSEFSTMEYNPKGRIKVEFQDEKISMYSACARNNKCYIAVNDCFDGINTTLLFDRSGNIIHKYEKVNTCTMMYNKELPTGIEIEIVELDFGKVGFVICADSYCQEIPRILGLKGAEIIINQTQSWGYDANSINEGVFRAWAIENCAYIVTCAFPSSQVKLRSNIIDATGETVFASNYDLEGAYIAQIDMNAVREKVSFVYREGKVIKDFNFRNRIMEARRPELYTLLNGEKHKGEIKYD